MRQRHIRERSARAARVYLRTCDNSSSNYTTIMYIDVFTVVLVELADRLQRRRKGVHATTRLNDPHPKGTEFQYMSLSCCMHSDTRSEGPEPGCQNQYFNLLIVISDL